MIAAMPLTLPLASRSPIAIATSVAGPRHLLEGGCCEDASACKVENGVVVAALADGLGSAPRGGQGAALAVAAAMEHGEKATINIGLEDLAELAEEMAIAARRAIECSETDPHELACTLIVCVGTDDLLATAHVGDGAVVGLVHDEVVVVSPPGETEYVNEVEHLGQDSWRAALRIAIHEPVSAFAAFSDGLQRAALKRRDGYWEAFAGFVDPLFEHARSSKDRELLRDELTTFLASKRLSEHSEDDKSLAIAILGIS